jgi:hypothetical protein
MNPSPKWSQRKNPKGVYVRVDMTPFEVLTRYSSAKEKAEQEYADTQYNYYKTYLRHLFPRRDDIPFDKLIGQLCKLEQSVEFRMQGTEFWEARLVQRLLGENKYIAKNTRRAGLVVKMFHTYYNDRDVFVKVYLYDPECPSFHESIESNFKNEAVFQLYANQLQGRLDFISPELYSWGSVPRVLLKNEKYQFRCLFLIMEYIPHITLKEATYSTENMKKIYEKVQKIDESLRGELLHHNDLHGGNIIVKEWKEDDDSPLPEIVLLDFGESSAGPRKPLYK